MDWKLILCMGLAAAGLLFGLSQWLRARRQLERMDRMLDRAIDGSFLESSFDESVPSALESKMSRFLNGSASSARNLAEEKSKIAALIADVSHQTKTPIANLLLYASLLAESELTPEQRAQPGRGPEDPGGETLLPGGRFSQVLPAGQRHPHSVPSTSPHPAPAGWGGRAGAGRRRTAWHFPHCPALGGRGPL